MCGLHVCTLTLCRDCEVAANRACSWSCCLFANYVHACLDAEFVVVCFFVQLGTSLVELTQLDMSHVTGITFASVQGFPVLRRLDLSRCDQLNPGALATALESFE